MHLILQRPFICSQQIQAPDLILGMKVSIANNFEERVSPHRPGLVHVISVSSIAFVVALLCGLMISYVIHRLVKAEEKQQLAMLYENVEIPLLEEKDSSEDESSQLDPENEELGKFIGSVIKTKIMENIKKKMKEEQNVLKGNTSENFSCIEKVETHEKLDKDGNSGNL
ncbi:uncharacterized protein C19orf18 homolog isoform X8 [Rattus norvegicus]|uniref:similar to human chromosome 19 open reading frame 18 isoform i n=1 Tax=Rattus norvegicus TaxID=10116 RepID=UPI0003D08F8E|nr:uncharacterized protein C19orf18 homolog isoform X7 [Rattus norvegicus]